MRATMVKEEEAVNLGEMAGMGGVGGKRRRRKMMELYFD